MKSAVLDQFLTVKTSGRSTPRSGGKSGGDNDDFGSMVRQKQRDMRGQRTREDNARDAKPAQASGGKKSGGPEDAQATEAPDEQYAIAAAMMMQSWLQMIPFNVTPEENTLDVEITPEFVADMRPTLTVEVAPERLAAQVEEVVTEAPEETFHEVAERVEREVTEIADKPVVEERTEETEETVVTENVEVETPVFGYMEAEPVKVASTPEAPVELEAPDGVEQLRGRIEEFLTDAEGNSYVELTLSPPELGKITVSLVQMTDGALHVQLSATTARAAELLERNTGGLQQLLASQSRPQVKVETVETAPPPYIFINPNEDNGQNQRNQQQNQRKREDNQRGEHEDMDFIQQLRLGLVGLNL